MYRQAKLINLLTKTFIKSSQISYFHHSRLLQIPRGNRAHRFEIDPPELRNPPPPAVAPVETPTSKVAPSIVSTQNNNDDFKLVGKRKELGEIQPIEVQPESYNPKKKAVNEKLPAPWVQIPDRLDFKTISSVIGLTKTLHQQHSVINHIMQKFENEFQFYYLIDHHRNDISSINYINFVSNLTKICYSRNEKLKLPTEVQKIFDNLTIKHTPHLECNEIVNLFRHFTYLDFSLDNYCVQTIVHMLKFHVNSLSLESIIKCKEYLDKFISRKNYTETEFITSIIEQLNTALKYAVQLKQNELGMFVKPRNAVQMLTKFGTCLSQTNYNNVLLFLHHKWPQLSSHNVLELLEALADRDYKHVSRLTKICEHFNKYPQNYKLMLDNPKLRIQSLFNTFRAYRFLDALVKLNFYDSLTIKLIIDEIMTVLNDPKFQELKFDQSIEHVYIVNKMLEACINFSHKTDDTKLFDYFLANFVEKQQKFESNAHFADFFYYAGLSHYDKITPQHLDTFVQKLKSTNLNNFILIRALKALCFYNQHDLATSLLTNVNLDTVKDVNDRLFLNDVFRMNLTIDESAEFIKGLRYMNSTFEEVCSLSNGLYEFDSRKSYLSNGIVHNLKTNEKCCILFITGYDKFRNKDEANGEIEFKKNYIKNSIKPEHIWVIDSKRYSKMPQNEILGYTQSELNFAFECKDTFYYTQLMKY